MTKAKSEGGFAIVATSSKSNPRATPPPNQSGIRPVEYRILVKPTKVEEVTAGGIIRPPPAREREQMAQADGELMAVGGSAFSDWKAPGDAPTIGDRLTFAKYAGIILRGQDGEEYRLLEDKEVFGVLT